MFLGSDPPVGSAVGGHSGAQFNGSRHRSGAFAERESGLCSSWVFCRHQELPDCPGKRRACRRDTLNQTSDSIDPDPGRSAAARHRSAECTTPDSTETDQRSGRSDQHFAGGPVSGKSSGRARGGGPARAAWLQVGGGRKQAGCASGEESSGGIPDVAVPGSADFEP